MQSRSVLLARGTARFDLGLSLRGARMGVLSTCLALAVTGCSFHARSEFHTGKGGDNSAGADNEVAPVSHEHAHHQQHPEGRHSPAGRDNVVRVSGGSKPAVEQGGGADEPARTAVHPTGDVPPSSGAGSAGASGASGNSGASGSGASGSSGSTSGADSVGTAASESPKQADSAPPGDATATDAPSTGKGTRKSPSEPHVAAPTQQKPRKVHRSDGSTTKEGRRD